MTFRDLPVLNAVLNFVSAVFLILGYFYIRAKKIEAHRNCMIAAFAASVIFLISYLTYHYHAGSVKYQGAGFLRLVYFFILITHIVLAASIAPMAIRTIYLGWRGNISKHTALARWTLPIWLYVSATGIIVYLMLYVFKPVL